MRLRSKAAAILIGLAAIANAVPASAQDSCAAGKTLKEGALTIATGEPAYFPWVLDNDPKSGKGFEAAVAYEIANRLGFAADKVEWAAASFDQSIQPGAKNFDFNLQQFSITNERDRIVDFSAPYYSAAMAVLVRKGAVDNGAKPTLDSLKTLAWGADANTTGLKMINELIKPEKNPLLYGDNADVVEAMKSNQIDAALFDLPTALYLSAVVLDDGVVLGQFPPERTENPDQFGLLLEEGNPLKQCLDEAIAAMTDDGTLARIEAEWLQETTGVPVIQ
jgi:polar amino acid transport system substrate-binding protein